MVMLPGLEAADLPADAIEVGRIADAWGIKGWFKVLPHSADPEALFSSKRWFLMPSERGAKTFTGVAALAISEAKVHSDTVVACAQDVTDRTAAEALRGARIFVSRAKFPASKKDEYYWVDLIGCKAINLQGEGLGEVIDVNDNGAHGVIALGDPATKTVKQLVPFVKEAVHNVNLPNRLITLDWQADW